MSYIAECFIHGLRLGITGMVALVVFCGIGMFLVSIGTLVGMFVQWVIGEEDEDVEIKEYK